jgi:PKD repeat protein
MLKRRIGTLILITCLILTTIPAVLGAQVTVNPPSGGAQTVINNAINSVASGATSSNPGVVLLTAGTYKITGSIILKSNVMLKGAGDSTIIYADGSVCNSEGAPGYVYGSGVSNVEVSSLQFQSSAAGTGDGGHGDYRNCIKLSSSSNCKIHDILFKYYLYCDGVRTSGCSGITVYNCRIGAGHDGICFFNTKNSRAYNNDIDIRTNTGIRVDGCTNVELDHNTFYGLHNSGWCCTEMESSLSGINIHHNIFHDYSGSAGNAAVQPVHASGSVSVHDNVLWNVGSIAFGTSSNNIINPSDRNVANWVAKGYGYGSISNPTDQEPPVASFSCNITSGSKPLTVAFTDTSINSLTAWSWNFGDGTSSKEQNPTHTYSIPGTHTVTLTVSNSNGSDSKSATITVSSGISVPMFPGYSKPPTDPNYDGLYEDINGNGILDFDDVVAYNDNMDWIVNNAPVALFDYNKNGLIDFDDVVKLNDML